MPPTDITGAASRWRFSVGGGEVGSTRRRVATGVAVAVVVSVGAAGASAYRHPVDAPVSGRFDAPANPYAPGNRGQEYAVERGSPIRAVAPGVVVFAGWVAGEQYVTVLHPDGLRSSYSPVRRPTVSRGEHVGVGQVLGFAAETFQLGVRRGDTYLDPATLIHDVVTHAVLVAD